MPRDLFDQLTTCKPEPVQSIPSAEDEKEALKEALIECGDVVGDFD